MITTKKVKLSEKEMFSILVIRLLKNRWWLIVWIWILAILIIFEGKRVSFDYFMIVLAFAYPILLVNQIWSYVTSKDNKWILQERYYEIGDDKINGIIDEETFSSVKIDHFIKVELIRKTYLIYIAKDQFICIPINSFESDLDREKFEQEIIKKIGKKGKTA